MLPKPEKVKKNAASAEQPDLFDSISKEDKIKRKRRMVVISLILTVGLSGGFWIYHSCRNFISSHRETGFKLELKLPQLNLSSTSLQSGDLDKKVSQIINKDPNQWSIYVKNYSTSKKTFEYAKNWSDSIADRNTIVDTLSKNPKTQNSLIQNSLPQGAEIQEIISNQPGSLDTKYLISIPQQQILMIFRYTGNDSANSQQIIPKLVDEFYWDIVQTN